MAAPQVPQPGPLPRPSPQCSPPFRVQGGLRYLLRLIHRCRSTQAALIKQLAHWIGTLHSTDEWFDDKLLAPSHMSKWRLITTLAAALAITATLAGLFSKTTSDTANPPITLRYIMTGTFNFDNRGYLSDGTTFWATNHTSKELAISLSAIHVRAGSNWTIRPLPRTPLYFESSGNPPLEQLLLEPHVAGYATVRLSGQPTSGIWRVEADVEERLTGQARMRKHLKRYPDLMWHRFRTGNTNIPANPFNTNAYYFGRGVQVVSEEISEE